MAGLPTDRPAGGSISTGRPPEAAAAASCRRRRRRLLARQADGMFTLVSCEPACYVGLPFHALGRARGAAEQVSLAQAPALAGQAGDLNLARSLALAAAAAAPAWRDWPTKPQRPSLLPAALVRASRPAKLEPPQLERAGQWRLDGQQASRPGERAEFGGGHDTNQSGGESARKLICRPQVGPRARKRRQPNGAQIMASLSVRRERGNWNRQVKTTPQTRTTLQVLA